MTPMGYEEPSDWCARQSLAGGGCPDPDDETLTPTINLPRAYVVEWDPMPFYRQWPLVMTDAP